MQFHPTGLDGAWLIELAPVKDERGAFVRTFCEREFGERGLETRFVQHSLSVNALKGTLRGVHFQRAPHEEVKLVRCQRGAIWDVIIDLRKGSTTYLQWRGFELSAGNAMQLYVPKGFAHGFQTLADDTHATYQVSHPYVPGAEGGVRWVDPAFAIAWPLPVSVISDKDAAWPLVAAG
jgi:dTDP-4-dehydrorhamnose 3,5-epimerase